MLKNILLVIALLSLCACQHSPRKEYFALSASAAEFTAEQQAPITQLIGVGPITIPEYLQHNKIAYWKNAQQLILRENHYWAEPLERGITRVAALELQTLHRDWRVVQFPWPRNQRPTYTLKMDILRLDAYGDQATLEVNIDWINQQTQQVIGSQRIQRRVACSTDSSSIARAYSELLQQTLRTISPPQFPSGG